MCEKIQDAGSYLIKQDAGNYLNNKWREIIFYFWDYATLVIMALGILELGIMTLGILSWHRWKETHQGTQNRPNLRNLIRYLNMNRQILETISINFAPLTNFEWVIQYFSQNFSAEESPESPGATDTFQ